MIREKYENHKEGMEILSLDEDELAGAVPQGSAVEESSVVLELRKLMEDVSEKCEEMTINFTNFLNFMWTISFEHLFVIGRNIES